MKRSIAFVILIPLLAGAFALTGCGKSPTAPAARVPDPGPSHTVPIKAVITKIVVTKFPAKKSDGSDWDLSPLTASRRPDLYVILEPTAGAADYVSNTVTDALSSEPHAFTLAVSGELPADIPYGTSRRIYFIDEDFGGDDDRVGWITVNLPLAFDSDNDRGFNYTFTDSGNRLSVQVIGTWDY